MSCIVALSASIWNEDTPSVRGVLGWMFCDLGLLVGLRLRPEHDAAVKIRNLGGQVYYRWRLDPRVITHFRNEDNARLQRLFPGDCIVSAVHLSGCDVSSSQLVHLSALSNLRTLYLDRTPVTDAGLGALTGLRKLRELHLAQTRVTDAGLRHVRKVPNLQQLNISSTRTTDSGLAELAGLDDLEVLVLSDTKITDAGVKHLKRMSNLRELLVSGTSITSAGVRELHTALPRLQVFGPTTDPLTGLKQVRQSAMLDDRTSIDHWYANVGEEWIKHQPGLSRRQRELLQETADAYAQHVMIAEECKLDGPELGVSLQRLASNETQVGTDI